jgi:hypothetical protein
MIGPRAGPAQTEAADASISSKAAAIELAKLLLLRTAFSFSGYPAGAVVPQQQSLAISRCDPPSKSNDPFCCMPLPALTPRAPLPCIRAGGYGQSALDDQLHGALDRNVRHAVFFVDPAVAVELVS